jgi:hypothetical protein
MRFIISSLLPVLGLASSLLPARQAPLATITSVTTDGPACPPSTSNIKINIDGTIANIIFDAFQADYEAGVTPPGERDLDCRIIFRIRVPIGCTTFVPTVAYHGFLDIRQGGVTGDLEPSYPISPGRLDGVNTTPTRFDSQSMKDFTRLDAPTARVTVRNPNEQIVTLESRTRLRIITINNQVTGVVRVDALDINLANQQVC